jgi:NAD+ kinase
MLALTPISAFRPRRWRGALLHDNVQVTLQVMEPEKRPVSAVADDTEARHITKVDVRMDSSISLQLLFDGEHTLEERIFQEQFF